MAEVSRPPPRKPICRGWPKCSPRTRPLHDFLAAVFDLSDFLRDCARRRPEVLDRLFDATIAERLGAVNEAIAARLSPTASPRRR